MMLFPHCFNPFQGFFAVATGCRCLGGDAWHPPVSIPFRGFLLLQQPLQRAAQSPHLFQSLSGVFCCCNTNQGGLYRDLPLWCFNPFQGFFAVATSIRWAEEEDERIRFNPFQGFFAVATSSALSSSINLFLSFNPFQGFFAVATSKESSDNDKLVNVSIPFRGFLLLQHIRIIIYRYYSSEVSIPFRGFLLLQPSHISAWIVLEAGSFNPFQGFFAVATFVKLSSPCNHPSRFNPFQGFFAVATLFGGNEGKRKRNVSIPFRGFLLLQLYSGVMKEKEKETFQSLSGVFCCCNKPYTPYPFHLHPGFNPFQGFFAVATVHQWNSWPVRLVSIPFRGFLLLQPGSAEAGSGVQ